MLVALRRATSPSIVLMRGVAELQPSTQAELLVSNLPSVIDDLVRGAIVTITPAGDGPEAITGLSWSLGTGRGRGCP